MTTKKIADSYYYELLAISGLVCIVLANVEKSSFAWVWAVLGIAELITAIIGKIFWIWNNHGSNK